MSDLAKFIDHTLLKPEATRAQIDALCAEAAEHNFATVCVNGSRVELAYSLLEESDVQVATVVGFPLGAMEADVKRYETEAAIDAGAGEIDMVMNVGRFIDGDHDFIVREIRDVVEAADDHVVKVILETCLLSNEQIEQACKLVVQAQAHFVKTSTGFGSAGATIEHVKLMRETVSQFAGVKAAGGIRNAADAHAMIEAGATRLGTSGGVAIVSDTDNVNGY
ncbi:MAG: deoxyribose-phosphate aldolase [Verrucomicrobiales bacterium]|jgi:deoxyribose-phosphate aldolase|nr:deoxyribose-phosphate aldolase [Verrucomicrobiales bacterium]MBT5845077.1 deoxyribose-phosphate aldolase [Verrucomicrobiales bacterium]